MHRTDDRRLASWRRTVEEFHRSGLSRREFCERKGIKKSSLDYWFKKVRQAAVESALVEVKVAAAPSPSAALEVSVAGRYRVHVHSGFDSELFAQVVRVLESLA
jgi:hypothetical protein